MKFTVFSDVHIGGKFNEEMFLRGVRLINEIESDCVIFCGDLTDQGTLYEYELVKTKYLPLIKKPVMLIPGNHDVKNVGDLLWEEYIGNRYFVHTDEEEKVKILGLDSNEPDKNSGRIGEKGIKRIYKEFKKLGEDWLKVLVFHHQTLPIRYTGRERSAITDAGDVIHAIVECNVQLVLNGHRHISNVYQLSGSSSSSLVVNTGTMSCKKTRYKEEYSITLIDYGENEVSIDVVLLNTPDLMRRAKFRGSNLSKQFTLKRSAPMAGRIIQIANTEFSTSSFKGETFAKMISLVNLMDCNVVVHCGDITNSSYSDEFSMAKVYISQIQHPLITVPGPKDYYPLGYELFRKVFATTNPEYESGALSVLGINTCILDDKAGRLGRSNLRRIEEHLSPAKINVVAFHHTIIPIARTRHEAELEDAGDVLAFFVDQHVDLVLTGAKNATGCWRVGDTIFVNAGTISSHNVTSTRGNSFNIIDIYDLGGMLAYEVSEYLLQSERSEVIGTFFIPKQQV